MGREVKMTKSAGNVFRDLGYSEPEARNLTMRSDLLIAIEKFVKNSGLTQTVAAKDPGQNYLVNTEGVREWLWQGALRRQ